MTDTPWDERRIAELRGLAENTSAVSGAHGDDASFDDAVTPHVVLSLLDALESARTGELYKTNQMLIEQIRALSSDLELARETATAFEVALEVVREDRDAALKEAVDTIHDLRLKVTQ